MKLDRDWIAAHIPHQGAMCLLDQVRRWDESGIDCSSTTYRAPDHPLRAEGRLGAACLIEYAAQAMAVHGVLLRSAASATPRIGLLASVRAVDLLVDRLDRLRGELLIVAERQHSDARGVLYGFRISEGPRLLAQGRAAVLLT